MKNRIFITFFIILLQLGYSQNDCNNAIVVCGNTQFSGLNVNGYGIQEISWQNSCSSQENNTVWIKVLIKTSGTLSFVLTPESNDINVDFDFFIFGPNSTCTNLNQSIRCSTTNPAAANSPNNTTGLNNTEVDESEGPGQLGNNFVKSIDVLEDESYYIVIDRPIGNSDFTINWTGTASFFDSPTINSINDISICDTNFNGLGVFDFSENQYSAIASQPNVSATFYTNFNDAINLENPINSISNYHNINNPETIYMRLTNDISGCFTYDEFKLIVKPQAANIENIIVNDFSDNNSIEVNTSNNSDCIFSLDNINGAYQQSNLFSNVTIGTHTVYTKDKSGCSSDEEIINVQGAPKFFTPNGDGYNDYWNLKGLSTGKIQNYIILIFDRFGTLLDQFTPYEQGWDGTYNGKKLIADDYWYVVKLENGKTYKGHFSLKR